MTHCPAPLPIRAMSDEVQKSILTEIRARHEQDQRWRNGPSMICPHAHDDRGWLLGEIERLRACVEHLEREMRFIGRVDYPPTRLSAQNRARAALTALRKLKP